MIEPFYTYFFGYLPKKSKNFIRVIIFAIFVFIAIEVALKLFIFFLFIGILSRILKYLYFLTK